MGIAFARARASVRRLVRDPRWATWNPLTLSGTELPSAVLLLAKLATIVFLLHALKQLSTIYLPFIPALDYLPLPAGVVQHGMQLVLLAASVALLCNQRVRVAALVLGGGLFFELMASTLWFENNRTYLACLFVLVGLTGRGRDSTPWLLRAQVIILYFGAGLNKVLDPDWRSGQFFAYWVTHILQYRPLLLLNSWLPNGMLWVLLGWLTILGELGLAVAFMIPRLRPAAMVFGIIFHSALYIVADRSFGMFFFIAPISYLAFVTWPTSPARMLYDGDCGFCVRVRRFFERLDVDRLVRWVPGQAVSESELPAGVTPAALSERVYLVAGNTVAGGFAAFKLLLARLSITYMAGLVLLIASSRARPWLLLALLVAISPLAAPLGERVYALVARNRHRLGSPACALPTSPAPVDERAVLTPGTITANEPDEGSVPIPA
jgi:predicted DCC family thiol-disulfide oxidoreductase YuxK